MLGSQCVGLTVGRMLSDIATTEQVVITPGYYKLGLYLSDV